MINLWKKLVGKRQKPKIAKDQEEAWAMQDRRNGEPSAWIQWKGTDVCMDLHCACGKSSHFDGDFAYAIECAFCHRIYSCNGHIELIELRNKPECCLEAVEQSLIEAETGVDWIKYLGND